MISINPENNNLMNNAINNPMKDSCCVTICKDDLLLKNISEEKEFKPLSKFPSIARDLSIYVPNEVRVGEILDLIQRISSKLVQDVDLIDFYEPVLAIKPVYDKTSDEEKRKGLTFRIIFQAEDRTLTDAEADREMAIINKVLIDEFDAELR